MFVAVVGVLIRIPKLVGPAPVGAVRSKLVPVARPITGVTRVGVVANTGDPVPVAVVQTGVNGEAPVTGI